MTTKNTFNITKLPDDLSTKILNDIVTSSSLSTKTLKSLANSNKTIKKEMNRHLYIINHKNIKKFVKYQNVSNILLIIEKSMFSLESLIAILEYVENKSEIKKSEFKGMFPTLSQKPSSYCLNNTYIIYQIIKHTFIMNNKPYEVQEIMDEILIDFFENVYMFKKPTLKSFNKDSISISKFEASDIGTWHLTGFNLYYFYEIYRMYEDNYRITMNQYKQIDKYIFSYDTNVLKRSIQYITEQYYSFAKTKEYIDYQIFVYILSFIVFKLYKEENVNHSDIITIKHEDEYESYKERISIDKVISRFEEYLNDIGDNTSMKILDSLKSSPSYSSGH